MTVSLVNPAQIRSFAKGMAVLNKTDQIDAVLLARYGCLAQPKAWTPPAEPLVELQALLARLDDLEGDLRREQNRYEQACVRGCSGVIKHSFVTSIRALKAQCKRLQQAIAEHFAAHEDLQADLKRLRTIPAVGPKTAMRMLALLRSHRSRRLVKWPPSWAWYRLSGSRAGAFAGGRGSRKPAIPGCVLHSTWQLLLRRS